MNGVKEPHGNRPRYDVWLFDFLLDDPSASVDTTLQTYIKIYSLAVCESLDEPARITDVRTRLAILEESGLLDPANSCDTKLREYAQSLRSSLEMYALMSPEARAKLASRAKCHEITKSSPRNSLINAIEFYGTILLAALFAFVWPLVIFSTAFSVATVHLTKAHARHRSNTAAAAVVAFLTAAFAFHAWYWDSSPLAPAMRKCDRIRVLWQTDEHKRAMEIVEDLGENGQPWEDAIDYPGPSYTLKDLQSGK